MCFSCFLWYFGKNSVPFAREKESSYIYVYAVVFYFFFFITWAASRIGMLFDFVSHNSISNQIRSVCLLCFGLFILCAFSFLCMCAAVQFTVLTPREKNNNMLAFKSQAYTKHRFTIMDIVNNKEPKSK